MNRAELQQLAENRVLDAQALLAASRWSAAYYLAGYAVECGLKSCVLAHIMNTGIVFQDKRFGERCWTHNLEELVKLAGLEAARGMDISANATLGANWQVVKDWTKASRYQTRTQLQAQSLFDAVTDNADGVLLWIRAHW